eukprot:359869-Chlamydomonas_euryale.AAC.1
MLCGGGEAGGCHGCSSRRSSRGSAGVRGRGDSAGPGAGDSEFAVRDMPRGRARWKQCRAVQRPVDAPTCISSMRLGALVLTALTPGRPSSRATSMASSVVTGSKRRC